MISLPTSFAAAILARSPCTAAISFSRASYLYSLFRPQIVRDLDLHRHGRTLLPRAPDLAGYARVDAGASSCTDVLPLLPPPVGLAGPAVSTPAVGSSATPPHDKVLVPAHAPPPAPLQQRAAAPPPASATDASTKTVSLSYQAFSGLVEPPPKSSR
jgi:hypothetical protein